MLYRVNDLLDFAAGQEGEGGRSANEVRREVSDRLHYGRQAYVPPPAGCLPNSLCRNIPLASGPKARAALGVKAGGYAGLTLVVLPVGRIPAFVVFALLPLVVVPSGQCFRPPPQSAALSLSCLIDFAGLPASHRPSDKSHPRW